MLKIEADSKTACFHVEGQGSPKTFLMDMGLIVNGVYAQIVQNAPDAAPFWRKALRNALAEDSPVWDPTESVSVETPDGKTVVLHAEKQT